MYTQLMVRVAIPEDGKFIFAGVYRGSTEIRAFEVDSIEFPSSSDLALSSSKDSDEDGNASDEDEDASDFGVASAQAVSHTYSDAKLKGFGAVKSILRSKTSKTEYHLLCGLGIKNLHLWRFFQQPKTQEWSWECVFDKQANGISLEFLSFHPSMSNQIISKSEHQNIRIWTLEEEYHDDDFGSVTLNKKSHVDVKNTVDTTAVYGDYAYGGSESLALIDLRSASRMELDLPLSTKEQQAQQDAATTKTKNNARITASMRQRNSRRRGATTGAEDLGGMRHMRTVSQVAGRETSPFTVGMCSDGSVFFHKPQSAIGMATPLEYVEGYERFFQDPSLSFQAQFSDLTRVNTSGLLSVLPLPESEKEDWMIVAANQDQLLVRSLKAFLCRNQQIIEHARVKRGLKNVLRDLGGAESSSSSSSSSESEEEYEVLSEKRSKKNGKSPVKKEEVEGDKPASSSTAPSKDGKDKSKPLNEKKQLETKPVVVKFEGEVKNGKRSGVGAPSASGVSAEKSSSKRTLPSKEAAKTTSPAASESAAEKVAKPSIVVSLEQSATSTLLVSTPKRKTSGGVKGMTSSHDVASPVVSVSSLSSGTSNPNTPEQSRLSQREKQLLVLKDLEWTPPPKAPSSSRDRDATKGSSINNNALERQAQKQPSDQSVEESKKGKRDASFLKEKPNKPRTKALFTVDEETATTESKKLAGEVSNTVKSKKATPVAQCSKTGGKSSSSLAKKVESGADASVLTVGGGSSGKDSASASTAKVTKNKNNDAGGGDDDQIMEEEPKENAREDDDAEMEDGEEGEMEDEDLEALEKNEPAFFTTPLVSDGGSLLSASLFQFEAVLSPPPQVKHADVHMRSPSSTDSFQTAAIDDGDDFVLNEQATLLLQFAEQNERLKRSFYLEKERIYQQQDCTCSSTSPFKKKSGLAAAASTTTTCAAAGAVGSSSRMNWKKSLSGEFLKRKQLKRRQKKQIALKLRQLHLNYRSKIQELLAMQKLEANALTARQKFDHFYQQSRTPPTTSAAAAVANEPQHLSISFSYPSLLS